MLKRTTNIIYQMVHTSKGFTLIELIVAIAILSVLATFIITTLNPYEQYLKAQDARRKSDLSQIQKAMEAYYQDNGRYPYSTMADDTPNYSIMTGESENPIKPWGTSWGQYMQVIPQDNTGRSYVYVTDDNGQSYWLYTSLQRGAKDPQVCNNGLACENVPQDAYCGDDSAFVCNYGVSSTNVSP